jgi:iron only hydrogenase large subunit-like protein/nitrogen-specific signal transduction histidine kinase
MGNKRKDIKLVNTVKERCKICYTCVRECPTKAIKIANGQAEVLQNRCIGCGNCIKVCSQDAKLFYNSIASILDLIRNEKNVIALVAPSFPAEFNEIEDYRTLIGMIKKIGFKNVHEVAFGADLVALKYRELLNSKQQNHYFSSDCPAIVDFVEKYYPHLIKHLIPIVSPMVATARVIKQKYGNEAKIVFIGPCIAKKAESTEVNEAMTFRELRTIFAMQNIKAEDVAASEFDAPVGGMGSIFPISRGLLQTVDIKEDVLEEKVIVADGRVNFHQAIKEFDSGLIKSSHLELLCCEGCIMGVGMSTNGQRYSKSSLISNYVHNKLATLDKEEWQKNIDLYKNINLDNSFEANDQNILSASYEQIKSILKDMGKFTPADHLNCGACGYDTCDEHAIAIYKGLAESEMCLPYTLDKLHKYNQELAVTNEKLGTMQQALRQSEKLAHMGQLSAGIAHELNNPLGVIIMYSNLLLEDCPADSQLRSDLELIVQQSGRCKNIVSGLLNFARNNQVRYERVDLKKLIEDSLHSIVIPEHISIKRDFRLSNDYAMLDNEQMIQVLSNLVKNAIEAMPQGGKITLLLEEDNGNAIFMISDTGSGIPGEDMDKLFTPFFTTKAPGKGTGLGLPTVYGIVKMHKGDISVKSNNDIKAGPTGTTFKITIPRSVH